MEITVACLVAVNVLTIAAEATLLPIKSSVCRFGHTTVRDRLLDVCFDNCSGIAYLASSVTLRASFHYPGPVLLQTENVAAAIFGSTDNAYYMYRALDRREIDTFVFAEGSSKNFGNIRIIQCPSIDDPDAFLHFLASFASARPALKLVVLPSSDEYAIFFAAFRDRLPDAFVVKCPSEQVVDICVNKQRFSEFCRSNDVRIPSTFAFGSLAEFERGDSPIPYPVIIKPTFARQLPMSIVPKVILAENREQLLSIGKKIWTHGSPLFFQEYIPGGYEEIVFLGGYVDRQNGILEYFVGTKEMEYPVLGGNTTSCRLVWQDDAVESSLRLLELLEYEGLFDIEYKRDRRNGSLVLIEINARIGLWHRVSEDGGMDIISYYVLTASGTRNPDQIPYRAHTENRVWVSTYKHLLACIEYFGLLSGLRLWNQQMDRPSRVRDDGRPNWRRVGRQTRSLLGRFRELGLTAVFRGVRNATRK